MLPLFESLLDPQSENVSVLYHKSSCFFDLLGQFDTHNWDDHFNIKDNNQYNGHEHAQLE